MEKIKDYKNVELVKEDFATANLPKLRDDFIAKLEQSLMFLSYRDLNMWHSDARNKVHLKNFDGAWLMDVSLRHEKEDCFTFAPFGNLQVTPEMFPNLNIKIFNLGGEIGYLSKYRFLDAKEKRHLASYKYIVSERLAFLDYGKQKWWTNEQGYGFTKINKVSDDFNLIFPEYTSLTPGYVYNKQEVVKMIAKEIEDKDSPYLMAIRNLHMALQLSLTYYYEWSCYIKEGPDTLGIKIPIHPSSSKEVFLMRNVPEGQKRKKAIVNFVKEHYRTITDYRGTERELLIDKHFRGELKFNWRGLEVYITPSQYDLQRVKTKKKFLNV